MTTLHTQASTRPAFTTALAFATGLALSLSACNKNSQRGAACDPALEQAISGKPAPAAPRATPEFPPNVEMSAFGETATNSATTTPAMHESNTFTQNVSYEPAATPTVTSTPVQIASSSSHMPPASNGVMMRRPGKMDPFWIEMTAEADRAIWDIAAAGAAGIPNNPLAASVMANSPMSTVRDDGVDGLTHVTFAPEGADFDPCMARDGSFMVFASTQHRPTSDIYMKRCDGRTITQLTSDPFNDIMPSISPDNTRLAFASNRSGNWDVYVMSSTGGQAVQITSDPSQELHPTWSPDGKRLAFCKMGFISNRWEIWVTDVNNGASAEFIGFGMFPEWCPKACTGLDGRDRILFQRSRERGGRAFSVWTMDYRPGDASSPTEIVASQSSAMINACWSPDGQRIVFATMDNATQPSAANPTGTYPSVVSDLWMSNIDGSGRVNLTSGQFMNLMPWWGADGRIYFVSDRAGNPNIWSMTTDKAIQAATGVAPSHSNQREVVNAPETHEASEQGNH